MVIDGLAVLRGSGRARAAQCERCAQDGRARVAELEF